jgi:diguanylate cyclase (GGDEF)-like protein
LGSYRALVAVPTSLTTIEDIAADSQSDQRFDAVTRLAADLFEVPIAFLSVFGGRRHCFKSAVGLPSSQISNAASFCDYAIRQVRRPLVVEDAGLDQRFVYNPMVAGRERIRFFAGMPVSDPQGRAIGVLGVIDRQPRCLSRKDVANLTELAGVVESLIALHAELQEATNAAIHDEMTGLANRDFRRAMAAAVPGVRTAVNQCAVLYIDLDGFKGVNDRWGHATGDAILREAAGRLAASVRSTDFVGRLGGDEFAILMRGVSEASEIESVAGRVIQRLAVPYCRDGLVCSLSASIGIARSPEDATTVARLLECADIALYAAKRAGRGCFHYYRDCASGWGEAVGSPPPHPRSDRFAVIESLQPLTARAHDDRTDMLVRRRRAQGAINDSRALLAKTRSAGSFTLCRFTRRGGDDSPVVSGDD